MKRGSTAVTNVRLGPLLLVVGLIVATRVFGISALMPVLSPYAGTLTDNALLAGLAFAGYGLTMAIMQLPLGALSDRIGRRRVIFAGLLVAIVGNLIAYGAPTIEWLIIGRFVEGIGAVSSVGLALLTDVVPEEKRTLSLAVAGIGAGGAFLIGVAVGPLLAAAVGVRGIFLVAAVLTALVLLLVIAWIPPDSRLEVTTHMADPRSLFSSLRDRRLLAADWAGTAMNLTLTATMFALPLLIIEEGVMSAGSYRIWLLVTVLVGGTAAMGAARRAGKPSAVLAMAMGSALLIGAGSATVLSVASLPLLYVAATVYFAAHGAQSAALPSRIGGIVGRERRGAAMGAYTSWTFLGSFLGGLVGAALYTRGVWLPVTLAGLGLVTVVVLFVSGRDGKTSG